uniref:C-type lectin domain-containing protein n=1 Tax=Acrobeloides nanus TaxID=290746 RepID=A0A914D563_9BILA
MLKIALIFSITFIHQLYSCPIGSIQGLDPNDCYQLFFKPTNWLDAEAKCVLQGGHLTSIVDAFHNGFVDTQIQNLFYNVNEAWLGGNTILTPGNWTWSDNTTFKYTNWAKGQAANNQNTCMTMNYDVGNWYSKDCNTVELPFVCKINISSSLSTATPVYTCPTQTGSPCQNEYIYYNQTGNCYKIYSNMSFNNGEARCQQDGAHLASVHSDFENEFISIYAYGGGGSWNGSVWIGLNFQNGSWQWTDGTPLDYNHFGCWSGSTNCYCMITNHYKDGCGDWYSFWDKAAPCDTVLPQAICKYTP